MFSPVNVVFYSVLRVVDYFGTSDTGVSRAPWSDVERSRLSDVEVRKKVTPQRKLAGGSLTFGGVWCGVLAIVWVYIWICSLLDKDEVSNIHAKPTSGWSVLSLVQEYPEVRWNIG